MKSAHATLEQLRINPDWAKLPLFDRSKWQRVRFGGVVRVLKEQVDPSSGEVDRYVAGEQERDRAKEALTQLFNEAKSHNTHIIVERIVGEIDDIVKKVRFPDWQRTITGERLVQKELRRALLKYKLHTDQDLFDRAYEYIRQYY